MTENDRASRSRPVNVADFFDKAELKALFIKFLVLIGSIEVGIFLACWFYQLGLKDFDRYGNVNIPFPWKTFFLLAFLVPVGITFLMGLFVAAFNNYMQSAEAPAPVINDHSRTLYRLKTWWGMVSQVPFLLMLLLLGLAAGVIYRLDAIVALAGSLGGVALKYIIMIIGAVFILAALLGLVWMLMMYKLKKQSIEFQYKRDVMERLGIVFLDDHTVVDSDGKTFSIDEDTGMPVEQEGDRLPPHSYPPPDEQKD